MKELYKEYINKFGQAKVMAEKYELPSDKINAAIEDINKFKVTVPLIGGFSTGKSSLINALLGESLLSTEITPETAVPAEIEYGKNYVEYVSASGVTSGKIEELNTKKLSVDKINLVRLSVDNEFLSKISTVKIVDMPGFDSGCEIHNRAIDDYLPRSLAYIITVSADEGTLRESVLNFLRELKLSEMPVYVVITKSDKVMNDDLNEIVKHVDETVKNILHIDNIKIAVTSADEDEIDEFREILIELQSRSDEVFVSHFAKRLCESLSDIRSYIISRLKVKDSTSAELEADIEMLEHSIEELQSELIREKENFDKQCDKIIESIKSKVVSDLRASTSTFENMLIQGNDISEKINYIIRNSVTTEINRQFEPRVRKYAENVAELINRNIVSVDSSKPLLSADIKADNESMKNSLQGLVQPVSTAVTAIISTFAGTSLATSLGLASSVLGPIGTAVGFIAGALLGGFINRKMREKEENQRREAASEKVSQVIEEVSTTVGAKIEEAVYSIRDRVNEAIEADVSKKIAVQRKSLDDTMEKLKLNEQDRNAEITALSQDLNSVEAMLKSEGGILNECK